MIGNIYVTVLMDSAFQDKISSHSLYYILSFKLLTCVATEKYITFDILAMMDFGERRLLMQP